MNPHRLQHCSSSKATLPMNCSSHQSTRRNSGHPKEQRSYHGASCFAMLQEPSEKKSPNCPESLDSGAVLYRKATVQSEKRKKFALLEAAKKSCAEVEVGYTTHKNWFLLRTLRSTNLAAKNCGARDCQCTGKVVFYSGWCIRTCCSGTVCCCTL